MPTRGMRWRTVAVARMAPSSTRKSRATVEPTGHVLHVSIKSPSALRLRTRDVSSGRSRSLRPQTTQTPLDVSTRLVCRGKRDPISCWLRIVNNFAGRLCAIGRQCSPHNRNQKPEKSTKCTMNKYNERSPNPGHRWVSGTVKREAADLGDGNPPPGYLI